MALSDDPMYKKVPSKKSWTKLYTDQEKLEAVKLYLITGNNSATAAALGMNRDTLMGWRQTQWWKDLTKEVKEQTNIALSAKLRKIADKALEQVQDRLENGEFIYDQKKGELIRKPVSIAEARKATTDCLDKAMKIETVQEGVATDQAITNRLEMLATAFQQFAKKATKVEVIDVEVTDAVHDQRKEGLQEGGRLGQKASGAGEGAQ
jgi:transposase-like protein